MRGMVELDVGRVIASQPGGAEVVVVAKAGAVALGLEARRHRFLVAYCVKRKPAIRRG